MKADQNHIKPNTLVASGSGSALLGGSLFGVPGAILGAIFGIGVGYFSEMQQLNSRRRKPTKERINA